MTTSNFSPNIGDNCNIAAAANVFFADIYSLQIANFCNDFWLVIEEK